MRCTHCDHALWRTVGRTCPECGTPFRPSEFTFRPSAVAFRCPHCTQDYYGTDARGLLEPPEFDCVRCGRHVHLDEMVLEPAAGRSEDETDPKPNPWAERGRIGLLRGWWRSLVQILFRPAAFGASLPPTHASASGLRFLLLCLVPQAILGVALLLFLLLPMLLAGAGPTPAGLLTAQSFFAFGAVFVLVPLAWIGGLVAHATLVLLGARGASLSRSVGCSQFAAGATSLVGLVPCVSCIPFITVIWWFASFRLMLAEVHRCSRWRAAIAAIVPLLLVGAAMVGTVALLVGGTAGVVPPLVGPASPLRFDERAELLAILGEFESRRGRPPVTPLELVDDDPRVALFLASLVDPADAYRPRVDGIPLSELGGLSPERIRAACDELARRRPDGAYRLGALVFAPDVPGFAMFDPVDGTAWIRESGGSTFETSGLPPGIDAAGLPDLLDPAPPPPVGR